MVGPLVPHAEEKLHLLAVQLRPWKLGEQNGVIFLLDLVHFLG